MFRFKGLSDIRSTTANLYIAQIQKEISNQDLTEAEKWANEWIVSADALGDTLERSRSRMLRAVVSSISGNLLKVKPDLDKALYLLNLSDCSKEKWEICYYKATAIWMLGCLLLQLGAPRVEIWIRWQQALNIIEQLTPQKAIDDINWFSKISGLMRFCITTVPDPLLNTLDAMANVSSVPNININIDTQGGSYIGGDVNTHGGAFVGRDQNSNSDNAHGKQQYVPLTPATLDPNGYFYLDVYPSLAAGPFRPNDDNPIDRIKLSGPTGELPIKGIDYQFYSLVSDKRLIRLQKRNGREGSEQQEYAVFCITGDSMNKDGIDLDDYVLVRAQETADPGNIVVLQAQTTEGADTTLTLKYFERRTETEWRFVPHSSDTSHPIFTYHPNTGKTAPRIVGIAIGVFKPQGDSNHGQPNL